MIKRFAITALLPIVAWSWFSAPGLAGDDDFNAVVKIIEQFYHVKHQSLPLLARAGIKATRTAARIKGGDARRLVEAGSARVVFFEDQSFDSRGDMAGFKASMQNTLSDRWSALIQTLAAKDEEQCYIYVRDAGEKFHVLVVTIERREATVVQATIAPKTLALLMQNPDEMGKELTKDATINDDPE